jgi:hypothetical protein
MPVRLVPYKDIDKQQWDQCIKASANRLIYAQSFYLDALAGEWDALVLEDYKAVMPLTFKKKFAIKYLYQPPFIQQLGIFSAQKISAAMFKLFEDQLLKEYSFAEITLNYQNIAGDWKSTTKERTNFVLDLNRSYEELYDNYLPAFTKSLRRIKKFQLQYLPSDNYSSAIDHYENEYSGRLKDFDKSAYANLKKVFAHLYSEGNLFTREVYSTSGALLAGVVLMRDAQRLYNIISFITDEGKKLEANYFMYDNIIQEFAGKDYLLDLEGSDVKGIANFYKKMNPVNQPYLFLKFNNLHPLIKIIKK